MGYNNSLTNLFGTSTSGGTGTSAQQQTNTYQNNLGNYGGQTNTDGWRSGTTGATGYSGQGGQAIGTSGTTYKLPGTYDYSTGQFGGVNTYAGGTMQQGQQGVTSGGNGQTSGETGGQQTQANIPGMTIPMPNVVIPVRQGASGQAAGTQTGTTGGTQTGTQAGINWANQVTYDQWMKMTPEDQAKVNNYMSIQAQMNQGGQNAYQYNQDFNAANQQFMMNFGRAMTQDEYQKDLSNRQLAEQIRQADLAYQTGQTQDNFNMGMANRQLGQQQYEFQQNQQLQQGQLDLQRLTQEQRYLLDTGQLSLAQVTQQQNAAMQQGRLNLDSLGQQQQYQLGQGRLASDTQQWQGAQAIQQNQVNNQNQQFGQTLAFEKLQNQQQYGLALTNQELQAELGRGRLASDTGQWQGAQANERQGQQLQNAQFYAGQNQQNQQFGQTLDFQKLQNMQQYGLAVTNQELEAELGRGRLASDTGQWQGAQAIQQQGQQIQNQQFGRQMTLQELQNSQRYGLDTRAQGLAERSQTEDTAYKQASLQQAAQLEAGRRGVDVMQIMNTKEYQDAQTQIERERLAQQGGLGGRELDIRQMDITGQQQYQQQQLAQQLQIEQMRLAAQKEQASLQSTGRLRAPKSRWLRAS